MSASISAVRVWLDYPRHIVEMAGELDGEYRDAAVRAWTLPDQVHVVVDLANVTFMDCSGLRRFGLRSNDLERCGGSLSLAVPYAIRSGCCRYRSQFAQLVVVAAGILHRQKGPHFDRAGLASDQRAVALSFRVAPDPGCVLDPQEARRVPCVFRFADIDGSFLLGL